MKAFFWLLILGFLVWLGYREVVLNGWPWERPKVASYTFSSYDNRVTIEGVVKNESPVASDVTVTCELLGLASTLKPKSSVTIPVGARTSAPFTIVHQASGNPSSVECRLKRAWER